jgi:hypothetical protein
MNAHRLLTAARPVQWFAAPLLLVLMTGATQAQVRLQIPGDLTVPYYMQGFEDAKSGWTATIFYRPPSEVPSDYNLLTGFDPSLPMEPLTVEGFALQAEGAPVPRQVFLREAEGGMVPIYFAPIDDIKSAISDGVLTIGELEAITKFVGYADSYHEVLQPTDSKGNFQINIIASGLLEDGSRFFVHCEVNAATYNVSIGVEP